MSIAMSNSAPTPSDYFTSGQHFLETFTLLPQTTRNTNWRWLQSLFPPTVNITFATYCEHTSLARPTTQRCYLNFLITPFRLFTPFLSHEACNTDANSILHAAIKNSKKHFDILELLSFIYLTNLVRKQLNVNTHTHVTTFPRKKITIFHTLNTDSIRICSHFDNDAKTW